MELFIHILVPSSCTTGNVRLVDGDNEMEGRVEVCRGGVWGAVYDYSGWNFNDAQVTCRQLGYPSECELACTCECIVVFTNYITHILLGLTSARNLSTLFSFCNCSLKRYMSKTCI